MSTLKIEHDKRLNFRIMRRLIWVVLKMFGFLPDDEMMAETRIRGIATTKVPRKSKLWFWGISIVSTVAIVGTLIWYWWFLPWPEVYAASVTVLIITGIGYITRGFGKWQLKKYISYVENSNRLILNRDESNGSDSKGEAVTMESSVAGVGTINPEGTITGLFGDNAVVGEPKISWIQKHLGSGEDQFKWFVILFVAFVVITTSVSLFINNATAFLFVMAVMLPLFVGVVNRKHKIRRVVFPLITVVALLLAGITFTGVTRGWNSASLTNGIGSFSITLGGNGSIDNNAVAPGITGFDDSFSDSGKDEIEVAARQWIIPVLESGLFLSDSQVTTGSFEIVLNGDENSVGVIEACGVAEEWFNNGHAGISDGEETWISPGFSSRIREMAFPRTGTPGISLEDANAFVELGNRLTEGDRQGLFGERNGVCHLAVKLFEQLNQTENEGDWEKAQELEMLLISAIREVNNMMTTQGINVTLPTFDGYVAGIQLATLSEIVAEAPTATPTTHFFDAQGVAANVVYDQAWIMPTNTPRPEGYQDEVTVNVVEEPALQPTPTLRPTATPVPCNPFNGVRYLGTFNHDVTQEQVNNGWPSAFQADTSLMWGLPIDQKHSYISSRDAKCNNAIPVHVLGAGWFLVMELPSGVSQNSYVILDRDSNGVTVLASDQNGSFGSQIYPQVIEVVADSNCNPDQAGYNPRYTSWTSLGFLNTSFLRDGVEINYSTWERCDDGSGNFRVQIYLSNGTYTWLLSDTIPDGISEGQRFTVTNACNFGQETSGCVVAPYNE